MSRIVAALMLALVLFIPAAHAGTSLRITITGDMSPVAAADNAQKSRLAAVALAADGRLAGRSLTVRIVGTVAVIKGRVFDSVERALAARIVGQLPGVSQVRNEVVTLEASMPTTLANSGKLSATVDA